MTTTMTTTTTTTMTTNMTPTTTRAARSRPIPRRALLRAGSVAIALPWLEQMTAAPARAQAARGPQRLVVMFKPNGTNLAQLIPTATGIDYAPPPSLQPLAPLKDRVVVVSGLQNTVAAPAINLHLAGIAALLTGAHPERARTGVSVDQVIAQAWRGRTSLPSLELGSNMSSGEFKNTGGLVCEGLPCTSAWSLSYADERTQVPTEMNPQAAFDRLFAGGLAAPAARDTGAGAPAPDVAKLRAYRQSVLDYVRAQTERLKARLGSGDRRRLDGYLTAVRDLEARLAALATATGAAAPAAGGAGGAAGGCSAAARPASAFASSYPDRLKAMIDVIALALRCDATRVVTFMMAEAESEYTFPVPGVGAGEGHHGTSHHQKNASKLARIAAIDRWYVEHVARLATQLGAMPEGAGTVLDATVVLHASEVSDGDSHSYVDMPVVLVGGGGGLPSGRHVRFAGRPLADLHLTLLRGLGVDRASLGNSTGVLPLAG